MPIQVVTRDSSTHILHSPQDFARLFGVRYVPNIEFQDIKTQGVIEKRIQRALSKGWITPKQKWLGHYYADGIRGKVYVDLSIKWIDEKIGFGLWTNKEIPAQAFVGTYAGLVRKRRLWKRWHNLYCFDYTIGERRSSSYVIDAQDRGNYTRFINHSFKPNLGLVSVYSEGLVHAVIYAKEKIPAGAQLCYDYGEEYWAKREGPLSF